MQNRGRLRQLKSKAHTLKPVVMIGNKGLTESVIREIDIALDHHELIKVKIAGSDKPGRLEISNIISERLNSELIDLIGQIAIFYRESNKN